MYDDLQLITLRMAKINGSRKNLAEYSRLMDLHLAYRDSNEKLNKTHEIVAKQLEFDYERKHVADSVRYEQRDQVRNMELDVAEARLNREKTTRVLLICILILIVAFAVFVSNRLRFSKRQNKIIEQQKQLVELKNREMLDSINYTKRLQEAILTQAAEVRKKLNLAILYLPKDIIGGDFYFFDEFEGRRYFAVCDCTGHGIPGAMMSIVCHQALAESIREHKLSDPGQILDKTRDIIIQNLNASQQKIRDGMDCTLIVIEKDGRTLKFSGAHNPLWINDGTGITEIKADKQSVSFYEHPFPFSTKQVTIKGGELLYLFTDGYADQFGGPKAKKYKYKSLKAFLTGIASSTPSEQVRLLRDNFSAWKGNLDQIDDVAIAVLKF
jgi:serine phosphatase RsbU (regulator of sigma subunit)